MVRTVKLAGAIAAGSKGLARREREQDSLVSLSRAIVRGCALAMKAVHARDKPAAEKEMAGVRKLVARARRAGKEMSYVAAQAYQEYAEARILLAVLEGKEIPSDSELGIPFGPYILGLMDSVGEFRREMLEDLKRGDRKSAEAQFEAMNAVYEATLPLRFSNSILPGFRKKQDVARIQLEYARSELLR